MLREIPPKGLVQIRTDVFRDPFGWTVAVEIRQLFPTAVANETEARAVALLALAQSLRRAGHDPQAYLNPLPEDAWEWFVDGSLPPHGSTQSSSTTIPPA